MKTSKKLLASAVLAATAIAPMAQAELSGSVGVASTYLWRGLDLGSGTPAVSGSIDYSQGAFYSGIWASSGDTAAGTEYDVYAGFAGGEDFTWDISLWSYNYPTNADIALGEFMEVVVTLGVAGFGLTVMQGISDNSVVVNDEYTYVNLSYASGPYSIALGQHLNGAATEGDGAEFAHLDLSYAMTDNLSFTVSAIVDDDDGAQTADPQFVVSYSLPIE